MNTLSIPDMAAWSMIDFELAFDGVRLINDATVCLQNQPRATNVREGYHPGADFIVGLGEDWCGAVLTAIVDSLEARRFPDPREEDRRLRLLLSYHCSWGPAGDPLRSILTRLLTWRLSDAA